MKRNLKKEKAFTLIELLIVIGILSILAITVLLALNPGEAQKKNRDLKRIRDAGTLQTIIDQFLNDGNPITVGATGCLLGTAPADLTNPADTGTGGCSSTAHGPASTDPTLTGPNAQPCNGTGDANWLRENVCNYTQTVPVDPSNNIPIAVIDGTGNPVLKAVAALARYRMKVVGRNYEIQVRQEAKSNASKVKNDGGDDDATDESWVEVGSNLNLY